MSTAIAHLCVRVLPLSTGYEGYQSLVARDAYTGWLHGIVPSCDVRADAPGCCANTCRMRRSRRACAR